MPINWLALLWRFRAAIGWTLVAVLVGLLLHCNTRSAVKDQHSSDVMAAKDARIVQLTDSLTAQKAATAKAETALLFAKTKTDARVRQVTRTGEAAHVAVQATGDTTAIQAVDSLVLAAALEHAALTAERAASDSVIAGKTKEITILTEQLALVVSRAEDQRRMDHRAVLREKARGGVAVAGAAGGAAIGAVVGGPAGAAIGAAIGGVAALVAGR